MKTAAYYVNKYGTQIRVSEDSVIHADGCVVMISRQGTYSQTKPLEDWKPSTREAFCKSLDEAITRIERVEKEMDLEENNEIAEAVVIRRAN